MVEQVLITFGGLFLLGLVADLIGRHSPLPRVTLLLLSGFAIGPSLLDWLPDFTDDWFPVLTDIALAMIGFLLGQKMTRAGLAELGRPVLALSLGEVLVTALLVFSLLLLFGVSVEIALLLAGIAPASAPAATVDVVHEYRASGRFTDTLLGIVAIDDAWGLLLFSLLLAIAQAQTGQQGAVDSVLHGGWEIGGALILGLALGLPMAYITGRVRPGEPTQAEALGLVMLGAGLAEWLNVSYILTAMIMGAMVANVAHHHDRPFRAIKGFEWPFMILFFLLAGAALHLDALLQAGALAAAYIGLRTAGLVIGARLGGRFIGIEPGVRNWIGLALLPQAGVAIGMTLLAGQRFPEIRDTILPVILGSTVIFELIGPVITRWTLIRAGDIPSSSTHKGRSGQ
ncbi:cation:proton antiporter [Thiohalobacter thiocyanaticus]|uniref:Cation:proton antiporter n=1 Tax=Thiohalobacter thiocyanaticus TaxID=585455 RepID=A0A426QMK6_9GAMM|nr:cation:proton antiporter [Thiohalobacter thiocyanaticus]